MITEMSALLTNIFPIVGAAFSVVFMAIVLIIMVKALRKTDVSDLFTSQDEAGGISLTKFWQNIAYAAATVSFLSINISGKIGGASLEIIWVIFLGAVASNAVMSKWISMKYSRTEEKPQYPDSPRGPYGPPRGPYGGDRGGRVELPPRAKVDDPDA